MQKYRSLLQYALPHWRFFALVFIATLASSALAALQPWPMKLLVDHVLGDVPLPRWVQSFFDTLALAPTPTRLLWMIVVAGLGLFVSASVLEVTLTRAWTLSGRRMVYDLAGDLFARLQRQSLLYHTRHAVGDTMGRVMTDSWCVYQVFDSFFFAPAHALLTMLVMIALMAGCDGGLTLLALAAAPFMVGASVLVRKPLRAAARVKREVETRIQSHLQQTLTGIPVVQAFVQEEREQNRFYRFADAVIAAQQRSTLVGSLNSLGSGLVATLGTGVILWVGARHVMDGSLSVGGLLVFLVYLTLLQSQMKVLAEVNTKLQGFSASVDRVCQVLDRKPVPQEKAGAIQITAARGHIRLEDIMFGYEPDSAVLRGISLEALPGQTIAIVGATGAGKTTLVNLLPRFFDPWQGRVLLDGHDLRDLELKSLRAQIALVLQEPFLFPTSFRDNIAYSRPDASRAEIEAAARAANAHEFINDLPQGYDTVIGEHGTTLSGGERQRLSIARALLRNAPVLILDEPTSALDAETERSILEALERLMRGRTTFLIAHRLSTVRRADRIVVLENGRVAESGTHQELLARGQVYSRLNNIAFEPRNETASTPH